VPFLDRTRLRACWYLQGQSAEMLGDCDSLMAIRQEFLELIKQAELPQTWTYPPGGPPFRAAATSAKATVQSR
jgi:hypothetical protein